jgi:NADH:ubiquinone oxidoreductase subunit H
MKRLTSFSLAVLTFLCLLVGTERRAWGYIDPGSGLIALQTCASVMAAYVYYIRRRIMAFFQSKKKGPAVVLPVSTKAGDSEVA